MQKVIDRFTSDPDLLHAALEEQDDEITRLRTELEAMTKERDALVLAVADHVTVREKYCRELEAMTKERDLAIAHDRQPYPTAWAYEQACKTLADTKQQLREALAACKVKDEALLCAKNELEMQGCDKEACDYFEKIHYEKVVEALAIQPDDSALQAWYREQLGEPVCTFVTAGHNYLAQHFDKKYTPKEGDTLYAPKGVK